MTGLDPHLFVVFGATGDLTARKLLPALFHLVEGCEQKVVVLGVARRELDDRAFRNLVREALASAGLTGHRTEAWCDERIHYHRMGPEGYAGLAARVGALENLHGLPGNRVLYLALPPRAFPATITGLGEAGLADSPGWTRLVVEKPFGRDLKSARDLNDLVHRTFDEAQVYRIDHYLGKETVQNLLVFRFANPVFEGSWNRDRVERVEVTVAESLGVGTRGGYYDATGVVRDMLQSHLAQVFALVAMEPPVSLDADAIRAEKIKVLRSVAAIRPEDIVLGRYTAGTAGEGAVRDYLAEEGVAPDSVTPTYAAVRLFVDNWRWQGVPFVLRTGKALAERTTQIAVTFRPPPVCMFHARADDCPAHSNVLYLTLQPDEGFRLEIEVKEPGETGGLRTIPLHFDYGEEFGRIPDAYETLLRDIVQGDQTLFVHAAEAETSWNLFAPALEPAIPVHGYPAGSWGPPEADRLGADSGWAIGGRPPKPQRAVPPPP